MEPFDQLLSSELNWTAGAGARRQWVLKSEAGEFARLRFKKLIGSLAVGETASGRWTLKREGFFQPRLTVRREGSTDNEALFTPGWGGGGTISFASGARFSTKPGGWFRSNWQFAHLHGAQVIQFEASMRGAKVTVEPAALEMPELSVLLLIGCYIAVLAREDDEAASAAATAMG